MKKLTKRQKPKKWKDTLHGFVAECNSRTMAWMLIRNACHEKNLEVPTLDKVIEYTPNKTN